MSITGVSDLEGGGPPTPLSGMVIQITRSHTTFRSYDAIRLHIGGLHFSQDIVSSRDIRLAARLAKENGTDLQVSPDLRERVDAALRGGI